MEEEIRQQIRQQKGRKQFYLYGNCSEIIWRLDVDKSTKIQILKALENKKEKGNSTYMAADFPNKFLGIMINCLKREREKEYDLDKIKLKIIENYEEDESFIEKGFRLAKLCLNQKMDRKEAQELLREHFEGNEEEEYQKFLEEEEKRKNG